LFGAGGDTPDWGSGVPSQSVGAALLWMTGVRGVAEAVAHGQVLTTSLGTLPRPDAAELRRRLHQIRDAFRFVKFADNPRARARVSPWAAAAVALSEGVEPIVHVGCRDRNRLGLQADLLGARLLDIRNVLCLRGDEIEASDQPGARAVHDLDVVDLISVAAEHFCVLAACDPQAGTGDAHLTRLRAKVAAGAQLLETQPVFELDRFARWLRWLREGGIDVPLLVDVSVVATPAEVERLERIPFVAAPTGLAARLRRVPGAGVELAAELAAGLLQLEGVAGCHLSPLGGDPTPALAVADRLK
jgi:5,10-methylenetetrahydrofolate reductase